RLEDLLAQVRDGHCQLGPLEIERCVLIVDRLDDFLGRVRAGERIRSDLVDHFMDEELPQLLAELEAEESAPETTVEPEAVEANSDVDEDEIEISAVSSAADGTVFELRVEEEATTDPEPEQDAEPRKELSRFATESPSDIVRKLASMAEEIERQKVVEQEEKAQSEENSGRQEEVRHNTQDADIKEVKATEQSKELPVEVPKEESTKPAPLATSAFQSIVPKPVKAPVVETIDLPKEHQLSTESSLPNFVRQAISNQRQQPTAASGSARVPGKLLDSLLSQSAESLVAQQRVENRIDEFLTTGSQLRQWKYDWIETSCHIQQILRQRQNDDSSASDSAEVEQLLSLMQQFINETGERIQTIASSFDEASGQLSDERRQMATVSDAVHDQIQQLRMVPFSQACRGLERTARDVAKATGKKIKIKVEGDTVALDRSVIEGLRDPLIHMVRNACDHGIEMPDVRKEHGKTVIGHVTVDARPGNGHVEISVSDNGAGLNMAKLRERAASLRLAENTSEQELARLIFLPGFSTKTEVSNFSGRGVGMDVVKSQIEALHGTVDVESKEGVGSSILIKVPLTLTRQHVMSFRAGGRVFGVSTANVERVMITTLSDLEQSDDGIFLNASGVEKVRVAVVAHCLGIAAMPAINDNLVNVIIVHHGEDRLALVVDEIIAERDAIVKGLGPILRRVRLVSGAIILPNGRPAPLLHLGSIVPVAIVRTYDDWLRLLNRKSVDLVVSDVDMPGMDGFMLTRAIKNSQQFEDIPVVLVTARDDAAST
ncbi:MAG: hypothetical protein CMJ78_12690, partial [Planctomycetaceae bacterium]|nr:hypothetical protein [Planctomycetaceae bacterium]